MVIILVIILVVLLYSSHTRAHMKVSVFLLPKYALRVGEIYPVVVAAVSDDLSEDALLGSDLGLDNLEQWTLNAAKAVKISSG